MEELIEEYRYSLTEVQSCITILQNAIDNDNDTSNKIDIWNFLESLNAKISKLIKDFDEIDFLKNSK